MYYPERKKKLFVALDESNHGRDEEIFVGAFSFLPSFAEYFKSMLSQDKRRTLASKLSPEFPPSNPRSKRKMDYRFCVVNRAHYERFGKENIPLEVARVFYNFLLNRYTMDSTELFIDGRITDSSREDIKLTLKEMLRVPYPAVSVISIPKTLKRGAIKMNNLLMVADYRANMLFRASRYDTTDPNAKYFSKRVSFPLRP